MTYNIEVAVSQTIALSERSARAGRESKGGKSELRRAVRRVTPGQGNLKDSGTENIPPFDSRSALADRSLKTGLRGAGLP